MTCSLTGTTLKLSPWKKLPGSINAIYKLTVLINLTPNFEAVTPANYIFTSTVFNASNVSLFTSCGQTMEFQYSTAASIIFIFLTICIEYFFKPLQCNYQ